MSECVLLMDLLAVTLPSAVKMITLRSTPNSEIVNNFQFSSLLVYHSSTQDTPPSRVYYSSTRDLPTYTPPALVPLKPHQPNPKTNIPVGLVKTDHETDERRIAVSLAAPETDKPY